MDKSKINAVFGFQSWTNNEYNKLHSVLLLLTKKEVDDLIKSHFSIKKGEFITLNKSNKIVNIFSMRAEHIAEFLDQEKKTKYGTERVELLLFKKHNNYADQVLSEDKMKAENELNLKSKEIEELKKELEMLKSNKASKDIPATNLNSI